MLCNTTLLGPYSVYPLYRTYHSSAYVLIHGMLTETHWILVSWFFQIGVPLWSVVDAFFVCVVSVVLLLTFFMWAWTCFFNPLYQNFWFWRHREVMLYWFLRGLTSSFLHFGLLSLFFHVVFSTTFSCCGVAVEKGVFFHVVVSTTFSCCGLGHHRNGCYGFYAILFLVMWNYRITCSFAWFVTKCSCIVCVFLCLSFVSGLL